MTSIRAFSTVAQVPSHFILGLYRDLLRNSSKISNYNFREHARRRVKEEFRSNKDVVDSGIQRSKYDWGSQNLEIVKRQSLLSHIYKESGTVLGNHIH